jgi:putative protease
VPTPLPAAERPHRRAELLAPAGGLEAGLAALQHGADAVYLGLKRYSARADAVNFTLEELDRFLGHARALSPARRAFVAVNTLVLDGELDGLTGTLGDLADLGVDALIVQDLGVARLARRHFPELELHASTQLAVHSAAGVETLRGLGFARVTLARELTLDEIRACAAVPGVEVEAFLHGALCYAYSGVCLFSSHVLGRSGNRGACAYPCRDRWEVASLDGAALPERLRSGFAFSMKDLALPDHAEALRDAGVACLKIEGRMKGPTYVAAVVDFYRRVLDGALPAGERAAALEDLQTTFARPWTTLYVDSRLEKAVADRDVVGHRGAPIGRVEAVVRGPDGAAIRFRTSRALQRHDGLQVEIPGLERPFGFGVGALRVASRRGAAEAFEAPAGAVVEVTLPADGYPTIPLGATVSCSSSQAVKRRFQVEPPNLGACRVRRPVQVEADVSQEGVQLRGAAEVAPGRVVRAEASVAGPLEPARDAAKMAASARAALEKLGDSRFRLGALDWRDPAGRFVPVSRLNEARRLLAERLDAAMTADARARAEAARLELAAPAAPVIDAAERFSVKVDRLETLDAFEAGDFEGAEDVIVDLGLLPVQGLEARLEALAARAGRERLRLGLPLIVRGWEERGLAARVAALRAAGFRRWELTGPASWTHLGLAPGHPDGLDLTSDWSLYAVNRASAAQLAAMGVRRVTLSTEDVRANLSALLARLGAAASVVIYEDSPLFISESCPYANLADGCPGPADCTFERMELTSSHGGQVLVVNERCRSFTLGEEPYNLSPRLGALRAAGALSFRVHFVHRPYTAARAVELWRALRRGEAVRPGHLGNFDREGW